MSDSEMIEYEINDELNESMDRNLAEVQIKNNNDINLQYTKNNKNVMSNPIKNLIKKEKQMNSKPKSVMDANLNKILQGKTVQNSALRMGLTTKNADLKARNSENSLSNKSGNLNYSSNARYNKNFSTGKNNLISKKIKEAPCNNKNKNADEHQIIRMSQANPKLLNGYNNFNTIGNYETEGFSSTMNKHGATLKMMWDTNNSNSNNNNTINNSLMKNYKVSIDLEKTKTITNNKTDYRTINSNMVNNSKNTLIVGNEKNSKFEDKLKEHLNTLKNQKSVPANTATYKENVMMRAIKNSNPNSSAKENKNLRNSNTNKPNQNTNFVDNSNKNLKTNKNKTNSYLNLKLNLDPSGNSNVKENDLSHDDYQYPQTNKNEANIKFLLSDQFKSSLDHSIRNNNKSYNSNQFKLNKSTTKKSLISFDLGKQKESQRSLSIGERLYRKSIAYKDLKEKRVSIELSKRNLETISNCSFKPKICEDSFMMNVKSRYATISNSEETINHNNDSRDFDSSYFIKHKSKLIESHKLKRELEDLKELKPSIKKPEHEIKKLTEKLYNETITLQVEREKLADLYFSEIYPFKPNISNKEEPNVEKFFDRLQNWIEKRNENYQKDLKESLFDYKTGQRLFHPTISETIDTSAHRQDMDLFSFLYEEQKMKQEKLQEREQIKHKYHAEVCNVKHTTHRTDEINKLLKEDCYANLFNILDHNDDGVIECNEDFVRNAEEKLKDKDLFDLFKPIFSELKEHEESLSREEFYLALDELFKVLNVSERRRILNWYVELKRAESLSRKRSIGENKEFTFHPQISDKSQLYYNHSKRYSKNFLDRNEEFLNTKDAYKQEKSKEKVQKELEGCTFKPEINKNSEEIDKRNKLAFLLNLNSSEINFDYLLKPQSKEKINNLSRI